MAGAFARVGPAGQVGDPPHAVRTHRRMTECADAAAVPHRPEVGRRGPHDLPHPEQALVGGVEVGDHPEAAGQRPNQGRGTVVGDQPLEHVPAGSPHIPAQDAFVSTTSIRASSSTAGSDGRLSSSGRNDSGRAPPALTSASRDSDRRCPRPTSSTPKTRATASRTSSETEIRPCSSHVYQATPTPASAATSSRRSPGARRRPVIGRPT